MAPVRRRVFTYDIPSGLVAYAAQCIEQPRQSAEASGGVCDYGASNLRQGDPQCVNQLS